MQMLPTPSGSFKIFRALGVSVYVHWSWLVIAYIQINRRAAFDSLIWIVAEYLTLFVIVLLHEYGHSLACRSVGGRAEQIVLWPLGGVAYVEPPPRPAAWLWSIAAGPLVNLLLVPVTILALYLAPGGAEIVNRLDEILPNLLMKKPVLVGVPDVTKYLFAVLVINAGLLIFNVMPFYPLDGGQILQSLLWFVVGRGTSLIIASGIGMVGGIAFALVMLLKHEQWWPALVGGFLVMQAYSGLQFGLMLRKRELLPRHAQLACPRCGAAPVQGEHWQCGHCGVSFDLFGARGVCPNCSTRFAETACPECRSVQPIAAWFEIPSGHGPRGAV